MIRPTDGSGPVLGNDLVEGASEIRLRIGVALQEASLDKKQTGRELLRLTLALATLRGRTRHG